MEANYGTKSDRMKKIENENYPKVTNLLEWKDVKTFHVLINFHQVF